MFGDGGLAFLEAKAKGKMAEAAAIKFVFDLLKTAGASGSVTVRVPNLDGKTFTKRTVSWKIA